MNTEHFYWINSPKKYTLKDGVLHVQSEPGTDFWQKTYYEFTKTNAPAFLKKIEGDFTFRTTTFFIPRVQYDQCGILLYIDDENWVKVSVEYESETFARLGSVVTNLGYSDWASTDIPFPVNEIRYQVSMKNQDVLIEYAEKGTDFKQMRILHLHKPPLNAGIGVYACSPKSSSFEAVFSEIDYGPCIWQKH